MARKRIALSVDPEYHELLTQIAKYQNKTITGVVTDFLEASRPTAEAMLKAFEDLYAGNAIATVESSESIVVATVRGTAFDPVANTGGSAAIEAVADIQDAGISQFISEE